MMKCSNCGAEQPEGSKFCSNCGADLVGTPAPADAPATDAPATPSDAAQTAPVTPASPDATPAQQMPSQDAAPTQQTPPAQAPTQQMPVQYQPQQVPPQGATQQMPPQQMPPQYQGQPMPYAPQPAKKSHVGLIVIIVVAVILALSIAGFFIVKHALTSAGESGALTAITDKNAAVEGSWEATSATMDGTTITLDPTETDPYLYMQTVFDKDGTGSIYVYAMGVSESDDFTYTIDGDSVTIMDSEGNALDANDYSVTVSGDTLTIGNIQYGSSSMSMTFTKTDDTTAANHRSALESAASATSSTSTTSGPSGLTGTTSSTSKIEGTWVMNSVSAYGATYSADDYRAAAGDAAEDMTLVFSPGNVGTVTIVDSTGTNTDGFAYTFDGTNITLVDSTGSSSTDMFTLTYDSAADQVDLFESASGTDITIVFSRG